jgi:hypothetical protein
MKVYTIAHITHECFGHGDFGDQLTICSNCYERFPPFFDSREKAQAWLDSPSQEFISGKVVEFEVH